MKYLSQKLLLFFLVGIVIISGCTKRIKQIEFRLDCLEGDVGALQEEVRRIQYQFDPNNSTSILSQANKAVSELNWLTSFRAADLPKINAQLEKLDNLQTQVDEQREKLCALPAEPMPSDDDCPVCCLLQAMGKLQDDLRSARNQGRGFARDASEARLDLFEVTIVTLGDQRKKLSLCFEPGSSKLSSRDVAHLKTALTRDLSEGGTLTDKYILETIIGTSTPGGTPKRNKELGEARAESARKAAEECGIDTKGVPLQYVPMGTKNGYGILIFKPKPEETSKAEETKEPVVQELPPPPPPEIKPAPAPEPPVAKAPSVAPLPQKRFWSQVWDLIRGEYKKYFPGDPNQSSLCIIYSHGKKLLIS